MSDFEMGTPEVSEIPVEQAQHPSPQERFGDLQMAMDQAGVSVDSIFGAAEPNIPASIAQGDWGQDDRGFGSMVPQPPPVPGHVDPPAPAPRRQDVAPPQPQRTEHGFVDPATSSPYVDATVQPPAEVEVQPRGVADMTPDEYLAATGNAPVDPTYERMAPARTPEQITEDTRLGQMRNEIGELKQLVTAVLAGEGPKDPEAEFAAQVGLDEYDPDHVLTAAEMRKVLARTAGSLYNETRNMVATSAPSPPVDQRAEAVTAQMLAKHPWLENLEGQAQATAIAGLMGQAGANPGAPSGTQSVQHHVAQPQQRPATFVERGSSINQQNVPQPRPRTTMADVIAAKRQRGEYVSTEELGMALREAGVNIPTKR